MLDNLETNKNIPFPPKQAYLSLQGDAGAIEVLASPENLKVNNYPAKNSIAIICHPHPLHGGTMDNKVVFTLHKAFFDFGCPTIRFNFRGVGKSQGLHDHGLGETDDLLTIIDWVKSIKPDCEIILAGFSFGAFISFKASKLINCKFLVSVAPVIHNQDYRQYLPISCPWLTIIAQDDEIISGEAIINWVEKNSVKLDLVNVPDSGHFFHGHLPLLKSIVLEYLSKIFEKKIATE